MRDLGVRWQQLLPEGVSLDALQTKNQQLKKRVAELEKALENSSANNWGNTFNNQAAKVVNSELEKTIEPLMSEVERLQNLVRSALRYRAKKNWLKFKRAILLFPVRVPRG
jgi:chaperonin cofactor prefoldin